MNKYQEALDKLISMISLEKRINSEHNKKFYEAQPLLQELVDKEKQGKAILEHLVKYYLINLDPNLKVIVLEMQRLYGVYYK